MKHLVEQLVRCNVTGDFNGVRELAIDVLRMADIYETFDFVQILPYDTVFIFTSCRLVMISARVGHVPWWGYVWRDIYGALPRPFEHYLHDITDWPSDRLIHRVRRVTIDYSAVGIRGRWFKFTAAPWW